MNVRFGIIGLGGISHRFAKVLKTAKGVELTAVASREQSRSEEFARQFGAKKAFDSYLKVIEDPEVDIIYDGLTHNFHYEMTKLCLERHKAVLCEKPFVTNRRDAEELVQLARTNQTLLMEAMWTRCIPAYQKAREWVRAGRIGEVKLITAHFNYHTDYRPESRLFDPKLAGGSLFDVGVYPIEFTTGILGEAPVSVHGEAQLAPNGVDAAAAIAMRFASGALASLSCGFNVETPRTAVIYGTAGSIVVDECVGPRQCELFDLHGRRRERFFKPAADGFIYQIQHVAELFRSGKTESDLIPLQDTVDCAVIFDELRGQWGTK
jgi:predicted dehydrogenase